MHIFNVTLMCDSDLMHLWTRSTEDLWFILIKLNNYKLQTYYHAAQVSGALRPTNINWLPVLRNIEPPQIRLDRATLQEYKKAQQLTDRVPMKEILREPPKSRLKSRRPFVTEAAGLASLNQTEQETWEQSWIEGVPPGHYVMTNPTCPQPGFTLPRRQFVTLNRLRCSQARCAESLYRWGMIASPACPCGESHQTTRHIVEECPLTAFPGGLRRLHEAGPDAVEWLSKLSMKLWECPNEQQQQQPRSYLEL